METKATVHAWVNNQNPDRIVINGIWGNVTTRDISQIEDDLSDAKLSIPRIDSKSVVGIRCVLARKQSYSVVNTWTCAVEGYVIYDHLTTETTIVSCDEFEKRYNVCYRFGEET